MFPVEIKNTTLVLVIFLFTFSFSFFVLKMDLVNKNVVDLLFLARKILDASGIEDLDEQFKKVIDQTTDIVCNHEIKEYSYSELTELWFKEAGVVGVSFEHQHTPTHTKEFKLNHVYEDNSGNFFLVYDYNGDDDDYLYYSNQNEGGTFRGDLSNKEDLILTGVLTIQDQVLQWRETTFRKYFPVTEVLIGSILAMQQAEHTQELLRFNSYPWRRETLIRVATKSSDSVSLVDFISCVLKIYFPDTIVTSDSEKIDISIHNDSNGIIIKFEKMTDDTFRVLTSDDKEEGKQITFHDQQEIKCIQIKANKMQIEKSEFGMKDFIEKCTEEMRLIFSDSSKTLTLIKNFALVSIARFTDDSITDLIAKCSHTDRGQDRMERVNHTLSVFLSPPPHFLFIFVDSHSGNGGHLQTTRYRVQKRSGQGSRDT
jgi:ATP-dependent Clp protease adapter protein ClpS